MKIKEYKNKIVLAELNPNTNYIMLVNLDFVRFESLKGIQVPQGVYLQIVPVHDVDKSIRFVEIPK